MKFLWVNFKIKFNWIRRELCSRSPLPNWSGAALPPAPCGWCCFPHSFFGLVLRDDGFCPNGDGGEDGDGRQWARWGRWGGAIVSVQRWRWRWTSHLFFQKLCCFHPLFLLGGAPILTGWCCLTLRLSGGFAPSPSLSPLSFASFRAVFDLILVYP